MAKKAKKKEKKEVAAADPKPVGPVITAPPSLHGSRIKLIRGGEEVSGIIISQDSQAGNDNFVFQWKDKTGKNCISAVDGDELTKLKTGG